MTFVNEKGGHHIGLTVLQTDSDKVECMLKNPILKKSENWAIQLTDFILSKQPQIHKNIHEQFLEIRPYDVVDMAAIYGTRHIFTPKNTTSVVGLIHELQTFCLDFYLSEH